MKIGFLITARLKSSRLPLKLLLNLNGRSLIQRVIDRTKKVAYIEDIILCTSVNPQDKPLVDVAIENGIYYYLGSELDVVQRLFDAAKFFNLDFFINITGENPLFSVEYANRTVDALRSGQYDFVYTSGLPIGCAVYGIRTNAFEVVCKIKDQVDTEIWGSLINQPEIFSVLEIPVEASATIGNVQRITTDYQEDYEFIRQVFERFPTDSIPDYYAIRQLLKSSPELADIHAHKEQAAMDPQIVRDIASFFAENKKNILSLKNEIYSR